MMTWNSLFYTNPVSNSSEKLILFNDFIMMFLSTIFLIVTLNLVYLKTNKMFVKEFYEEHKLETVWTMIPFMILAAMLMPSINYLYNSESNLTPGMKINITGNQWYWNYKYQQLVEYSSYMISQESSNLMRLLDVDNRMLVPSKLPLSISCTSSDVIHSWTLPSLGMKMDAIPGRINMFTTSFNRKGIYFGQCSEICGTNHSFMPIVVESVKMI